MFDIFVAQKMLRISP